MERWHPLGCDAGEGGDLLFYVPRRRIARWKIIDLLMGPKSIVNDGRQRAIHDLIWTPHGMCPVPDLGGARFPC